MAFGSLLLLPVNRVNAWLPGLVDSEKGGCEYESKGAFVSIPALDHHSSLAGKIFSPAIQDFPSTVCY